MSQSPNESLHNDFNTAWIAASSGKYPPVKECIVIILSTHPNYKKEDGTLYPFVRIGSIPEPLHSYIKRISIGSNAPAPDDLRDSFWQYDVNRWLRAIGIQTEFVEASG